MPMHYWKKTLYTPNFKLLLVRFVFSKEDEEDEESVKIIV